MNILLIHQYFLEADDGGGSRFNEMTAKWIDTGHNVTVLAGMMHANATEKREEYKGRYIVEKRIDNVRILRCYVSGNYNKGFAGRLRGYFAFVFSSLYAGLFKTKEKFDCIIVTSPPLFVGISAYMISRIKKVPFLNSVKSLNIVYMKLIKYKFSQICKLL